LDKQEELHRRYAITFSVVGILHGKAWRDAKSRRDRSGTSADYRRLTGLSDLAAPLDAIDFIRRSGADVLFENTPVNYDSGNQR